MAEALHIQGVRNRARMAVLGLTELVASVVADETIAVSTSTRRWVPCSGVIPNGIDLDRFQPGIRSEVPSILFVGTYAGRKQGRLLMEHFQETVRPRVADAELWMVCDDAPSAPGVQVLGRVTDAELAGLYSRAWTFCLPSSYEGFGIPYVEAMAAGVPVVATPNPGALEVLDRGQCGVIVEPPELGRALVRLLQDEPRRDELADLGRSRSQSYELDAVARSYEIIYARLLSQRTTRLTRRNDSQT